MKRIYYFDVLKTIAIICVLSVHFIYVDNFEYSATMSLTTLINRYFFSLNCIGVPLFFMINGALVLNNTKTNYKKILNKAFHFFAQMLVWKLITIILICLYHSTDMLNVIDIIKTVFLDETYPGVGLNHFWFIVTLISIYFLIPSFKKIYESSDNKYIFWFLFVILVVSFVPNDLIAISKIFTNKLSINPLNYFNFFNGLISPMLFYFLLGGVLQKYKQKIKIKSIWLFVIFLFGTLMLMLEWYLMSKNANTNLDNVFWSYSAFSGIIISVPVFLISSRINFDFLENHKILKNIVTTVGSNTLGVYYLHWILGYTLLDKIWYNYINSYGIVQNLFKAIFVTVLLAYFTKLMKRIPVIKKLF